MHQGKKLHRVIMREGMRQKEAAGKLGYSPEYLSKLIKREELPLNVRVKAKDYFRLSDSYFINETDDEPSKEAQEESDNKILENLIKQIKKENEELKALINMDNVFEKVRELTIEFKIIQDVVDQTKEKGLNAGNGFSDTHVRNVLIQGTRSNVAITDIAISILETKKEEKEKRAERVEALT